MPKIFSKYDSFVGPRGEVHDESVPCYVDDVGYISMEQQIKSLINAGVNLENYRRSQFDYQYGMNFDVDSAVVSPENDPDFMPSVDMPGIVDGILNLEPAVTAHDSAAVTKAEVTETSREPENTSVTE